VKTGLLFYLNFINNLQSSARVSQLRRAEGNIIFLFVVERDYKT